MSKEKKKSLLYPINSFHLRESNYYSALQSFSFLILQLPKALFDIINTGYIYIYITSKFSLHQPKQYIVGQNLPNNHSGYDFWCSLCCDVDVTVVNLYGIYI